MIFKLKFILLKIGTKGALLTCDIQILLLSIFGLLLFFRHFEDVIPTKLSWLCSALVCVFCANMADYWKLKGILGVRLRELTQTSNILPVSLALVLLTLKFPGLGPCSSLALTPVPKPSQQLPKICWLVPLITMAAYFNLLKSHVLTMHDLLFRDSLIFCPQV